MRARSWFTIPLAVAMFACIGCDSRPVLVSAGDTGPTLAASSDGLATPAAPDAGISGVTVTTNSLTYALHNAVEITIWNGTSQSIFLESCPTWTWQALEAGHWIDVGSSPCQVLAVTEVRAGERISGKTARAGLPGTRRIKVPFGIGCSAASTLDQAGCQSRNQAFSAPATFTTTVADCVAFDQDYQRNVKESGFCNPSLSKPQCTIKIASALRCSCDTFVNGSAEGAQDLASQWAAAGCSTIAGLPPCGIRCPAAKGAVCGGDWRCQTTY